MGAFQVTPTSCTLGRILEVTESCHKLSFSPKVGMISYDDLSEDEVKLIQYRSGCYHFYLVVQYFFTSKYTLWKNLKWNKDFVAILWSTCFQSEVLLKGSGTRGCCEVSFH